jgi:hypothetical protein
LAEVSGCQRLLREGTTTAADIRRCSVELPNAKLLKSERAKLSDALTLSNKPADLACLAAVARSAAIEVMCSDNEDATNRCLGNLRKDAEVTCSNTGREAGPFGVPYAVDCRADFDCVDLDVVIDSITTDDRKATIHFTRKATLAPSYAKLLKDCSMAFPGEPEEALTAVASLADNGEWVLEQRPKGQLSKLPVVAPVPAMSASIRNIVTPPDPRIGAPCKLQNPEADSTVVFTDERWASISNWNYVTAQADAHPGKGNINPLASMEHPSAPLLPNGTRVIILKADKEKRPADFEVQIDDGDLKGQVRFIPAVTASSCDLGPKQPAIPTGKIRIHTAPRGARVTENDAVLCDATPCDVEAPESQRTLTLALDGYEPGKLTFTNVPSQRVVVLKKQ